MQNKITQLRQLAQTANKEARVATEKAAALQQTLERLATKRAGVSMLYLALISDVIRNPLSGAYSCTYERILDRAIEKGVVNYVFGGAERTVSHGNGSGNSWFEVGTLGLQIMRDIHGEDWVQVLNVRHHKAREALSHEVGF